MRLADFILQNTDAILNEWDAYARRIWPREATDPGELRDHAEDILRATAADMASAQTRAEQSEKSMGGRTAGAEAGRLNTASSRHGGDRVGSGLTLKAMVSEYRALRASVIRLWRESTTHPDLNDLDDLTRFNESIDQSLSRAVDAFNERL